MQNKAEFSTKLATLCEGQHESMMDFWKTIVTQESGSYDVEDVNKLGDILSAAGEALGGHVTRLKSDIAGDPIAVTFNCEADSDTKRVLMVCHRDTVFPHGTIQERPFKQDETNTYGPGVADMKGGIVLGIHAVKLLQTLQDEVGTIPMEIIFTSDEEIGSAASSKFVTERAKNAKAAFFLEPARANGKLVTGRDGGDLLRIEVTGHSAHAGNAFAEGKSAIHALAEVIYDFAQLTDDPAGYSTNVGKIGGGVGAIIVADHAWADVYTRFHTLEQREYLLTTFQEIAKKHTGNGINVTVTLRVGFLPFMEDEKNDLLYQMVKASAVEMGFEVEGIPVLGAADAGITSCAGVPTICGMGPVGGNLHTEREYAVTASMVERLKLLAMSIVNAHNAY